MLFKHIHKVIVLRLIFRLIKYTDFKLYVYKYVNKYIQTYVCRYIDYWLYIKNKNKKKYLDYSNLETIHRY